LIRVYNFSVTLMSRNAMNAAKRRYKFNAARRERLPRILAFIRSHRRGVASSDVARHIHMSQDTAFADLKILQGDGLIELHDSKLGAFAAPRWVATKR